LRPDRVGVAAPDRNPWRQRCGAAGFRSPVRLPPRRRPRGMSQTQIAP
jgi:hypothetical protein